MAANSISWPVALRPQQAMFHPDVPSRSGGLSLTGYEQITISNAGRWRARVEIRLRKRANVLAWRALIAHLQGRAGTILVPKFERHGPLNWSDQQLCEAEAAIYADEVTNFDNSAWGQSDFTHATLAAAASQGATQVSLTLVDSDGPQPGQYFGIADRLHLCHSVWQDTPESPTQVQFWPPLRSAAALGAKVILDRPVCLMRLADDASGETMLDLGRRGSVTLDFVEAL